MRTLIFVFLIFSLALIFTQCGCAQRPVNPPKFSGRWQFMEAVPGETMACLKREDVQKLYAELMMCRNKKDGK